MDTKIMTSKNQEDINEFDTVLNLIAMKTGFVVSFDELIIYRLENGHYVIDEGTNKQRLFDSAFEAVNYFWLRKEERKLGFDYEAINPVKKE